MKENDSLEQALVSAVQTTMEKIAFQDAEIQDSPVDIKGEVVSYSLQVVSPYLLLAKIDIPRELAARLTRTIYRDDEKEISDTLLDDTVGEFLNTIIGTMMGNLTLGERIFEMGLPQKAGHGPESASGNCRRIFFRIEEFSFCMQIFGDVFTESG